MKKQKYISHKEFMAEMMKRPGFKKAYDDLELNLPLSVRSLISACARASLRSSLPKKVGTKQSAIARFESGNSNPTLAFVKKTLRGA